MISAIVGLIVTILGIVLYAKGRSDAIQEVKDKTKLAELERERVMVQSQAKTKEIYEAILDNPHAWGSDAGVSPSAQGKMLGSKTH